MSRFLLLLFFVHLLELVLCSSAGDSRLSVIFLHERCKGEGYSTEELELEEVARVAAEDVSACSETPVDLTPVATVRKLLLKCEWRLVYYKVMYSASVYGGGYFISLLVVVICSGPSQ